MLQGLRLSSSMPVSHCGAVGLLLGGEVFLLSQLTWFHRGAVQCHVPGHVDHRSSHGEHQGGGVVSC